MENLLRDSPEIRYRDTYGDCPNNILTLSDSARTEVRARIAASDGTLRVFVHPFFLLHPQADCVQLPPDDALFWKRYHDKMRQDYPSVEGVERAFREAVRTDTPDQAPLVVFEEGHRVQDLIHQLRDTALLPYIVPTMQYRPTPLAQSPRYNSPWSVLRELFLDLGVRNIPLGGMLTPMCVAVTHQELEKAFYVEQSLPVHPSKNILTVDYLGL